MSAAYDYAKSMQSQYVGVEHCFYAIATSAGGVAKAVLSKHGVNADGITRFLEKMRGTVEFNPMLPVPLTPRLKETIKMAELTAKAFGHPAIEPEHLLVALTRADGGPVVQFFAHSSIDAQRIRDEIISLAKPNRPK